MPIPATASSRRAQRAFTLIELLVVIVIIGVVISVAVLSVNALGRDNEVRDETRRLVSIIDLVREQAEMQGRDFGLRLQEHSYEFLNYDVRSEEWRPVADDDLLRQRELPPGLRFRLLLEAREVALKPPVDDKPQPPQIMLLSSGDLTAFEMHLEREASEHAATITAQADGKVDIKEVHEARR